MATQVTDAGLVHLAGLTRLRELNLGETKVTDAGLEHLRGLNQLDSLHLAGSKVTSTGINGLQEALPNCLITPADFEHSPRRDQAARRCCGLPMPKVRIGRVASPLSQP